MRDDKISDEIAPQDSSPASVMSLPEVHQSSGTYSTTQDTIGKAGIAELAPTPNPVITSPIPADQTGASEENKQPNECHETGNNVTVSNNLSSIQVKIVARLPLEDDDHSDPFISRQVKNGTVSKNHQNPTMQAKVRNNNNSYVELKKDHIDTTAPFESVKAAVSMFGGIVDWKAHRVQTVERRKIIEHELEKAQEEIPSYMKQSEAAEEAKLQVLKELESTKKLVEELKLNLERVQTEEQQARQISELAKLRVEEIEQGIANEMSFAARAQLEVAHGRHTAALSELQSVKEELENLKKDYALLMAEKDASVRKANEAISKSRAIEKSIEDLTLELKTVNESLDSARTAHLEAEEHRIRAVMAMEQNILDREKELKNTEEELERVTRQISASKDLKSKLDMATGLLQELKSELASYMDSKFDQEGEVKNLDSKTNRVNIEAALSAAKKELEAVKLNLERANNEVSILKLMANSLKSQLENEKTELAAIKLREGMAWVTVSSLESELERTRLEIAFFQAKEIEEREQMIELPKKLQEASQEAGREKALADKARKELRKAKEEADRVKAVTNTVESRLRAARKEIDAARASEKLALAAISALAESESENSPSGVTITLEEYYELSKRVHEAEEQANMRVAAALSEIEAANESELRSLKKLEEADREMDERRVALETALEKAEKAKEGKLGVEHELRKWRAENEQKRKSGEESVHAAIFKSPKISIEKLESRNIIRTPDSPGLHQILSPKSYTSYTETDTSPEVKVAKKKKSVFPKIFMFLGKKKSSKSLLTS